MAARNRIRWDGLDDLRAALRTLPTDLAVEADGIVFAAAEGAHAEIAATYTAHRKTGNLAEGLALRRSAASRFGAGAILLNRAFHAHLFERGTKPRAYSGTDKAGRTYSNAGRGTMKRYEAFVPPVQRHRATMYDKLRALLERHGLLVQGDAA